jgi:hypothetical protein
MTMLTERAWLNAGAPVCECGGMSSDRALAPTRLSCNIHCKEQSQSNGIHPAPVSYSRRLVNPDTRGRVAAAVLRSFPRKRESSESGSPPRGSPRRERRGVPLAGTSGERCRAALACAQGFGDAGWQCFWRATIANIFRARRLSRWLAALVWGSEVRIILGSLVRNADF